MARAAPDSTLDLDPEGLKFRVQGVDWEYHEKGYVLLYKPAGTECSQKPSAHPSIYTLLPMPLRQRPNKNAMPACRRWGAWTRIRRACCCSAMMASSSTA
jgi:16S rRNA pseudouridine516 synthase